MARNNGAASTLFLNIGGGNVAMTSSGGGNVGIGTTAPTQKLHVIGNIFGEGNLDVSGYVGFGSVEQLIDSGGFLISCNSNFVPSTNCGRSLGSSTKRWNTVFACNGTINTSDRRNKTNIQNIHYGIKDIMKLNPVSFEWNYDAGEGTKLGLIAQELQNVLPEVVRDWHYETDETTGARTKVTGDRLGVFYSDIIPVLIKGMQEQQQQIDAKDKKAIDQQEQIDELKASIKNLETALSLCCTNFSSDRNVTGEVADKPALEQNAPNPFSDETTIRYYLPSNSTAVLKVMSLDGKEMLSTPVTKTGYGEVNISGSTMAAGTYTYTLIVNGKAAESKIMVLTK
jgi:hypothetical protein